jgi:hypothetical protein
MSDNIARLHDYTERKAEAAFEFEAAVSGNAYRLDAEAALAEIRDALNAYRQARMAALRDFQAACEAANAMREDAE